MCFHLQVNLLQLQSVRPCFMVRKIHTFSQHWPRSRRKREASFRNYWERVGNIRWLMLVCEYKFFPTQFSLFTNLLNLMLKIFLLCCYRQCGLGTHSCKGNNEKITEEYFWFAGFRDGWHTNWRYFTFLPANVPTHRCVQYSSNIMVHTIIARLLALYSLGNDDFTAKSNLRYETFIPTESIGCIRWLIITIQPVTGRTTHGLRTNIYGRAFTRWKR